MNYPWEARRICMRKINPADARDLEDDHLLDGELVVVFERRKTIPQCCIDAKSYCFKCGKYYWE